MMASRLIKVLEGGRAEQSSAGNFPRGEGKIFCVFVFLRKLGILACLSLIIESS
jgi:hypothetical protein